MKKIKRRDVWIDADHIIFLAIHSNKISNDDGFEDEDNGFEDEGNKKVSLKPYKLIVKSIIQDYIETAQVENVVMGFKTGAIHVVFSAANNFRYGLFKDYKKGRPKKSDAHKRLLKWAMKKYIVVDRLEADDVVSYYASKGHIGISTDKDVLYSTAGTFYDSHHLHKHWIYTSKKDANRFILIQNLMGDLTDNIVGIKRVGEKTAVKLLNEFGWNWEGVVKAYESKGLSVEDAILTRRLISMNQWSPKKGLILWYNAHSLNNHSI